MVSSLCEIVLLVVIRIDHLAYKSLEDLHWQITHAPLVFINSSDSNSAKIFTLIHELAHLWINQSGISSVDLHVKDENNEEKFCNAVSAEVLVPKSEFIEKWDARLAVEENAISTASYF